MVVRLAAARAAQAEHYLLQKALRYVEARLPSFLNFRLPHNHLLGYRTITGNG
jgi:hypothetical protein